MIWGFKELLWAALALMFAVLLAYVLIITIPRGIQGESVPPPEISAYDARLDILEREAVEEAYKQHLILLFASWMKDYKGQPFRAQAGARTARRAFVDTMTAIDQRRQDRP